MDILIENVRIITGDAAGMDAGMGNIGITGNIISYIGNEKKMSEIFKKISGALKISKGFLELRKVCPS